MQLWTQIISTAATLAVLLAGLLRGMGAMEVLTRAVGTYVGAYFVVGTLFLLGRTAMRSPADPGQGRPGQDGNDEGPMAQMLQPENVAP